MTVETHREGGRHCRRRLLQQPIGSSHMQWNTTHCRWDSPTQSSDCGDVPRIGKAIQPQPMLWNTTDCRGSPPMQQSGDCGDSEKTTDVVAGVLRCSSRVTVETQRRQQMLSQESSDVQSGDCGDSEKMTDVVVGVLRCTVR